MGAAGDHREAAADRRASYIAPALEQSNRGGARAADVDSRARDRALPAIVGNAEFPDAGRGLPDNVRARVEPELGIDLSSVRIHTSAEAGELARSFDARAFALGNHVVFASPPRLETAQGRRLLAHELAHVGQQATTGPLIQRSPFDPGLSPAQVNEARGASPASAKVGPLAQLEQMSLSDVELYKAALSYWVDAHADFQLAGLLDEIERLYPRAEGPLAPGIENAGRAALRLSRAEILNPAWVLSLIRVTPPELLVPSPPPGSGTGFAKTSSSSGDSLGLDKFKKLDVGKHLQIEPFSPKAKLHTPLPGYGERLGFWVAGPKGDTKLSMGAEASLRFGPKHSLEFGVSSKFGSGHPLGISPYERFPLTPGELVRYQLRGHDDPTAAISDSEINSADVSGFVKMKHELPRNLKLAWTLSGGASGGSFELSFEVPGVSKRKTYVVLPGTLASADKSTVEGWETIAAQAGPTIDALASDLADGLDKAGKLAKAGKQIVDARKPLVEGRSAPTLKLTIKFTGNVPQSSATTPAASATKAGSPAMGNGAQQLTVPTGDPELLEQLDQLGGRSDPRFSPYYLNGVSGLLGGKRAALSLVLLFELNF